ncbi:AAA family ATPase [Brevibacillus laterosporus]|uniref:AAA family ATPase n=1 Tax=Brevibacillus laterosporus TaxID=1465 RepID=UPI0026500483|nr:ATP-binding protein [Brevibacillus laterosporus]MDN9011441.1 ATP-binding protein [Brevibacillus laterosporus]MDO0942381.1 ATP-binding protein [Brevibacillus laterosporus]
MKLDCTHDGSLDGLCHRFFHKVDAILGTSYSKGIERLRIEQMLDKMEKIATVQCLGLLIIDEIQHLSHAKSGGAEKMLNFLHSLVVNIGVPVIFIGTPEAIDILGSKLRIARKGSGQGEIRWEPMKNDSSWKLLIQGMWKYQWTKHVTPLTDELIDTLYDESQGIVDYAVKLFRLTQQKLINLGKDEIITPEIIRKVAKEDLPLSQKPIRALRENDVAEIVRFGDIRSLETLQLLNEGVRTKKDLEEIQLYKQVDDIKREVVEKPRERKKKTNSGKEPKTYSDEGLQKVINTIDKGNATIEDLQVAGLIKNKDIEIL